VSLLELDTLVVAQGARRLVDGVSLRLAPGEAVGLVGESGSGKTLTALSFLELVPPSLTVTSRALSWRGQATRGRALRGHGVGMVFQEPMTALNPVYTVGDQMAEVLLLREPHLGARELRARLIRALAEVGIAAPEARVDDYPHALSGGMRQRVMIAMACLAEPALLVADEPTTALDVTVQAQILALLARLRAERGMALLLVSHDLAVVASACARVVVMYAGRVVEEGPTAEVLGRPLHPYTRALLAARPERAEPGQPLVTIPGKLPDPDARPSGCRFRDRCALATAACVVEPPRITRGPEHQAWCVVEPA
jgi:oligopeptide/dipeptide ABC transporter ATP-binding protein